MTKLTDLEFLQLPWYQKFWYKFLNFWIAIPAWFVKTGKTIGRFFKKCGIAIKDEAVDIVTTFIHGDWKTKLSYLVMGFGSLARGQILRGILFLLFEIVFIIYMVFWGATWLGKFGTLGTEVSGTRQVWNDLIGGYVEERIEGDDSFKILLYGLLTIVFICALVYTWRLNVKQNKIAESILKSGKKLKSNKQDLKSMVDDQFHKTLLALPVTGIFLFTVLPIFFMILVAFTNYDGTHDGYNNLFTWVGWDNFNSLFNWNGKTSGLDANLSSAFGEILGWTLIWAFFATFSNYFLGMAVAMAINKKGIKFKKVWRGILVLTSAVPQFVSLLYISKMFAVNGIFNSILKSLHLIKENLRPWESATSARILVIIINIWIGIPYLMLITTGVLMNIPADMYESARIDGANPWQSFIKITVPYMFFVTGPYLLTSFTGNLNNFNVIFLLTGGGPTNPDLLTSGGSAGYTDLLITWLFNITTGATSNYKLASVIGILIFIVVAFISLVIYNILPSNKNEEDYS